VLRDAFLDARMGCEHVAWHFPGDDLFAPLLRSHGLPIGSLTSQVWANAFLTPVDHVIASHLGLGTFVRYCDDILVFDDDAGRLRDALVAIQERAHGLRLRLHPDKTRLHRTADPVAFLGFVLRQAYGGVQVRLRTENVRRFRRRMALNRALFEAGALDACEVVARVRAWLAHARHGHTRTLCEAELARLAFVRE
jgi:RNA-directed DNA polymerase